MPRKRKKKVESPNMLVWDKRQQRDFITAVEGVRSVSRDMRADVAQAGEVYRLLMIAVAGLGELLQQLNAAAGMLSERATHQRGRRGLEATAAQAQAEGWDQDDRLELTAADNYEVPIAIRTDDDQAGDQAGDLVGAGLVGAGLPASVDWDHFRRHTKGE